MSQRDMQQQDTVDSGASATDGYSPAGEAPTPATRLLDLPPALLDDIACRVMQLGARSLLPLTCRAFSQARLLHVPALRIQLGRQCCDQLLTPRVVAALQARTSKLSLTLWQPETEDSECYKEQLAPTLQLQKTEYTQDYTDLLAHALAKLDKCAAVEVCKLVSSVTDDPDNSKHLHCSPGLAQHLLDNFPRLTALTLKGLCVSSDALASLLSHPPLALQLQQLHLSDYSVPDDDSVPDGDGPLDLTEEREEPGGDGDDDGDDDDDDDDDNGDDDDDEEPGAVVPLFQGLRLKQLRMDALDDDDPGPLRLPSFQPLAQHLTQLHLACWAAVKRPSYLMECLHPLAQLQVLTLRTPSYLDKLEGLSKVLQALPQLHTLQLPDVTVRGQQQLATLLAATQITSLQLDTVEALDASHADAPCSWQRLELTWLREWITYAYLPLHSLSQPLLLGQLNIGVEDISDALHRLAEAITGAVKIRHLKLNMRYLEHRWDSTPALIRQQRLDLAQLVALLQPLQCCAKVLVRTLHGVAAADVLALAPLCQDCTHFELDGGSIEPSLEFWHQLVQLMPAVQRVEFKNVKGSSSAAMHESLQLMAEQPWARWLDITICYDFEASQPPSCSYSGDELPACWQAGSWVKGGVFKVNMFGSDD